MKPISLSRLANLVQAVQSENISPEWVDKHTISIEEMLKALPHGSGIDGKCEIQMELCQRDKLVFLVEFHHMDEHGGYDGWTYHNLILRPSFIHEFTITVTGKNRNNIKEYLHDLFHPIFKA